MSDLTGAPDGATPVKPGVTPDDDPGVTASATAPALLGHRLTAAPTTPAAGPRWTCSCGQVFADPQVAAQHSVATVRPRRPR